MLRLALALLVAQVVADDHDPAVTADHLALVTDLLDAGLDLHGWLSARCVQGRPDARWAPDGWSLVAVDDAPAGEVIWAELHHDPVAQEDPDVVELSPY